MHIEAKQFTIEMSYQETWATAWDIRYALMDLIRTHWVNHQASWKKNETNRLYRLEVFFSYLGRKEIYEEVFREADEIFLKFNEKRGTA